MAKAIIAVLTVFLSGCIPPAPAESSNVPDCTGATLGAGDVREAPAAAFLFAGQSNMRGLGQVSQTTIPDAVVWVSDHWETYQPSKCFGPELAFVREHGPVGVIKLAIGSTSMGDWQPNWTTEDSTRPVGSLFEQLVGMYRAANVPVLGVVWAQGEADASDFYLAANYESRLQSFLVAIRSEVGQVPFVIAQTQHPTAPYINIIQTAQTGMTSWEHVCMAETAGLGVYDDGLHFDTTAQLTLGARLHAPLASCCVCVRWASDPAESPQVIDTLTVATPAPAMFI